MPTKKKLLLKPYLCIFECSNSLASIIQVSYALETSYSINFNFIVLHAFIDNYESYKIIINSNFGGDHFRYQWINKTCNLTTGYLNSTKT